MKYYGKAQSVAQRIVAAFEHGEIPGALAARWLRNTDVPCSSWSVTNQILVALNGTSDARGCRQWNKASRHVKKGEKAFYILAPCLKKWTEPDTATGEDTEHQALIGFRSVPVFGIEQTDGEPTPEQETRREFIDSLPLLDVARAWEINITTYNGEQSRAMGYYSRDRKTIALGAENLRVWAHELIHAADHRAGSLTETRQHWRSEAVAELGSATLLQLIGRPDESDIGAAYEYIKHYAEKNKKQLISACNEVLNRVAACIDLILETANEPAAAA